MKAQALPCSSPNRLACSQNSKTERRYVRNAKCRGCTLCVVCHRRFGSALHDEIPTLYREVEEVESGFLLWQVFKVEALGPTSPAPR